MIGLKLSLAIVLSSMAISPGRAENGMASFYRVGNTASGEVTGPAGLTAAHRTLAFGTKVLVKNVRNGKTVIVRITDRGPYGRGRSATRYDRQRHDNGQPGTSIESVRDVEQQGKPP